MIDWNGKYGGIKAHLDEIERKLSEPEAVKDRKLYADLSRSQRELSEVVRAFERRSRVAARLDQARQMTGDGDPEMAAMAQAEVEEAQVELEEAEGELQLLLLPSDPRDARNTIIEIRAGTGGEEAGLFARDLFEMYSRYAEARRWKIELLSAHETDLGGFKEICFLISGDRVYSRMKYEGGTHRVQRVPATEAQGRIHTSTVTVAILPEAEDFDIQIRPDELKLDTFRASGAGGQHVNRTESAVRITHLPTGTVVACQDERSQIQNRERAMKLLRARLYDEEQSRRAAERAAERKGMVGSGDRSDKIRTYNFPQNRLTDHRIKLTLHYLDRIMLGNLDEVIDALMLHYQTELLKSL
jgi:peptide chain release factor 1